MEIRQQLITPNVERNAQQPKPAAKSAGVERVEAEQKTPVNAVLPRAGNAESRAQAESFRQTSGYDQPQGPAILALEAYASHERETKRAAIREMMGVDLYA
ncbi:hypothetical protein [uncultured Alteromonas sp.]|jgi:hypothetical protein|uniref:hypothetical protein n=1 Tax=uncultured Alteromonas sp. TaxID=179113 RepID=UPI0025E54329|nr:hypothetical protein [uncultured Alteromonas sp.]